MTEENSNTNTISFEFGKGLTKSKSVSDKSYGAGTEQFKSGNCSSRTFMTIRYTDAKDLDAKVKGLPELTDSIQQFTEYVKSITEFALQHEEIDVHIEGGLKANDNPPAAPVAAPKPAPVKPVPTAPSTPAPSTPADSKLSPFERTCARLLDYARDHGFTKNKYGFSKRVIDAYWNIMVSQDGIVRARVKAGDGSKYYFSDPGFPEEFKDDIRQCDAILANAVIAGK